MRHNSMVLAEAHFCHENCCPRGVSPKQAKPEGLWLLLLDGMKLVGQVRIHGGALGHCGGEYHQKICGNISVAE